MHMTEPKVEPRLLVTCFAPFGGETVNASQLAVEALPDRIGPWILCKRDLPVAFCSAGEEAVALAEALQVQAVLAVGQAAGRSAVTPETGARNLQQARIPDNNGAQPQGTSVLPGGPETLPATLPVENMVRAMARAGVPAALSHSAGTYVCNDLYYRLLHRFAGTRVQAAFVHVPVTPAQGSPSLDTETVVRGLTAAILALEPN